MAARTRPGPLGLLLLLAAVAALLEPAFAAQASGGRHLLAKHRHHKAHAAAPAPESKLATGAATSARHLLAKQSKQAAPAPEGEPADCCGRLPAGFNSSLPVVLIDLQGAPFGSIPKPQLQAGAKRKIHAAACTCNSPSAPEYSGPIGFSERGSHSEDYNIVRSYSVSLNHSSRFLGMPKGKSWAFYGPQNDTMGLHDWLGFWLYRRTGNYGARTQYVELFVTSGPGPVSYPGDYLGLYLAMEHIDVGKDRVDLSKPNATDLTGGYLLDNEHDKTKQGEIELAPLEHSQIQYLLEYPPAKDTTQAMQDYILGFLRQFEAALFGPASADSQAGWRRLANESSAIDYFLFNELVKSNNNGYRGSQRLNKPADAPLKFGPPWDFNDGFGQCCGFPVEGYQNSGVSNGTSGGSAISPEGWMFRICEQPERCRYDPINGIALWYLRMWQDPAFRAAAAARFLQLRSSAWDDGPVVQAIKATQAAIHAAAMRTFARWPADFFNPYAPLQPDAEAQLQATVDKLVQCVTARLAWLEAQFRAAAPAPASGSTAAAAGATGAAPSPEAAEGEVRLLQGP